MRTVLQILLVGLTLAGLIITAGCDYSDNDDIVVVGNDIIVRTFDVRAGELDLNSDASIASYQRDVPELTPDVVDDGAVLLYVDNSLFLGSGASGTWALMPFTEGVDFDDDLIVDYTLTYQYSFDLGDLYIDIIASATEFDFSSFFGEFRLVMIPGDLFVGNARAGVDFSDYEAVREAFALPE